MQNPEKKQDFRVTLPLGGRDGDRQGSILREASREQQGPQELSSASQHSSAHQTAALHCTGTIQTTGSFTKPMPARILARILEETFSHLP